MIILCWIFFYSKDALRKNQDLEFERNKERFQFLRVCKLPELLFIAQQTALNLIEKLGAQYGSQMLPFLSDKLWVAKALASCSGTVRLVSVLKLAALVQKSYNDQAVIL